MRPQPLGYAPVLAIGDFNEVTHQSEHDGVSQRSQAQMDGFRDALDVCGLIDLGYKGRIWTSEKKVAGGSYTRVRLDRAVAEPAWCALFPAAEELNSTAACSDHGPIVIQLKGEISTARPSRNFKYEVMCDRHTELKVFLYK